MRLWMHESKYGAEVRAKRGEIMSEGFGPVIRTLFRGLLVLLGGMAGFQIAQIVIPEIPVEWVLWARNTIPAWIPKQVFFSLCCIVFFGGIGFIFAPLFTRSLAALGALFENHLKNFKWQDITSATLGMIVGLLIANLLALPFSNLPFGSYIAVFLNVTLAYVGARIVLKRQNDIKGVFAPIIGLKEKVLRRSSGRSSDNEGVSEEDVAEDEEPSLNRKLLDTSVIIDGRILDVAKTGFLEGSLVLPRFVLLELQAVADSTDPARRTRGRRGLDVVNELQKIPGIHVEIVEFSLKHLRVESVDSGLTAMAQKLNAQILTTDYNLNKIAQIQGIRVLNVNDLANALKPMLLPGESIVIDVIREGKEPHQGVGYLDDGTMLVIEDGETYLGRRVEVVVTSMLQTSAGRMVFGRIRREIRA